MSAFPTRLKKSEIAVKFKLQSLKLNLLLTDCSSGQGHFNVVSMPTRLGGDLEGEKIVHVHGRGDCVLAVSGKVKR